jgi:2-polyprenyl-3-methyl-5-hydroxy-6-metoxy-1,4-benzoquinol methylase
MFKCPVCSSTEHKIVRNINSSVDNVPLGLSRPKHVKVSISKCLGCGLEFNSKIAEGFEFSRLYTDSNVYSSSSTYKGKEDYPKYSRDIVEIIKSHYKKGFKLLEVGCFTGDLLNYLRKSDIIGEGEDLDPKAAKTANERGLKVFGGSVFDTFFNNKKYDLIVGIAIIEHVEEPVRFLKRLRRMLRKGGKLILQYPNNSSLNAFVSRASRHGWDMYAEEGHIFFYDKNTISRLLKKCGFELESWSTATILNRGKLPIIPWRAPQLEKSVRSLNQIGLLYSIYKLKLKLLDCFQLGDTTIIVAS